MTNTTKVPGILGAVLLTALGAATPAAVSAGPQAAPPPGVVVDVGPVPGVPSSTRTISPNLPAQRQTTWYDVQDGVEHHVRGMTLADLLAAARPPRAVDTVVFKFVDGMQIPVHLRDRDEVKAIFIALEHGDPMDRYERSFRLRGKEAVPCPKVVYARETKQYSIWHYPTQLDRVALVNWKSYEGLLAQPTRQFPDRTGWPIYLRHCQPCHGMGAQGAKRGSDFLSQLDAYRRVPPLAVTDRSQQPSLHEKVKGFVDGTMPRLDHVSNDEISTLWRWLHAIHRGATK